ncbi:MAG: MGMT family protein [Propionibacteriaceae bacterium]|nr:MGMT family protein [Propionibacteriaceae bacterium]
MATDEALVERILRAVEQVPPGRIVAYGDIAALVGIGPRHVGNVLSRWGAGTTWWRVTNRNGELPPALLAEALPHWRAEGIALKDDASGCRIALHRADLDALAADWARAVADLPG